jgi:hypothetical protein
MLIRSPAAQMLLLAHAARSWPWRGSGNKVLLRYARAIVRQEVTANRQKAATLEREFEAAMQAIMAAAIAVDASYALIRSHVHLPPSIVTKWRTNRTARYVKSLKCFSEVSSSTPRVLAHWGRI